MDYLETWRYGCCVFCDIFYVIFYDIAAGILNDKLLSFRKFFCAMISIILGEPMREYVLATC